MEIHVLIVCFLLLYMAVITNSLFIIYFYVNS